MANSSNQGSGSNRGFANMDEKKQREIASEGGRAAHASGNAHEFTSEDACKGGRNARSRGGSREQHAEAGRQSHAVVRAEIVAAAAVVAVPAAVQASNMLKLVGRATKIGTSASFKLRYLCRYL